MSRHDLAGCTVLLCLAVVLFNASRSAASPAGSGENSSSPTVSLDTLHVPEPHCRTAGQYGLGNGQKDSLAVLLICKKH